MRSGQRVSRRQFFGRVGCGIGGAALGSVLLDRLGFGEALAAFAPRGERLHFGALDPLVDLMQETPADELVAQLIARLRTGVTTSQLIGAAALANARALGGTHYNGYHALMAMAPSAEMGEQMAPPLGALPVLKVVHRSARFVRDAGRTHEDALAPLPPDAAADGSGLVDAMHALEVPAAEARLAASLAQSRAAAFDRVQEVVREDGNVHRVVLSWRAVDLLRFTGEQHALTLLRQSVRYCIEDDGRRAHDGRAAPPIGTVVRELMERHGFAKRAAGTKALDDAQLEKLAETIYAGDGKTAAEAVAAALVDGFDPERSAPRCHSRRRVSSCAIRGRRRSRRASRRAACTARRSACTLPTPRTRGATLHAPLRKAAAAVRSTRACSPARSTRRGSRSRSARSRSTPPPPRAS